MQPGATLAERVREQGQLDVEHLTGGDVEHPVRQLPADPAELDLRLLSRRPAQIVHPQPGPGGRRGDGLRPVIVDPHAQHAVPVEHRANGGLEPSRIDTTAVELVVEVRRHPAKLLYSVPTHPVRVLQVGELERIAVHTLLLDDRSAPRRAFNYRSLPEERTPGRDRRIRRELSERHVVALGTPACSYTHHRHRVQAALDEVVVIVDRAVVVVQQVRHERRDVLLRRRAHPRPVRTQTARSTRRSPTCTPEGLIQ